MSLYKVQKQMLDFNPATSEDITNVNNQIGNVNIQLNNKASQDVWASVTDFRFNITPAKSVKGVSVSAGSTSITGSFTADMNGKYFYLMKGGAVLATTSQYTWEASPLVGTFTYVSSTTGTLSTSAVTAVSNGEIIIGADVSSALTNAIATAGTIRIPSGVDLIIANEVTMGSGNVLEGASKKNSRIFSVVQKMNGIIVPYAKSPKLKNFSFYGNAYGQQPANVTPTIGDVNAFVNAIKWSGCGVTFARVDDGIIEDVDVYHCGGDMSTNHNGIAGIYLTMGCRTTKVLKSSARFCRNGINEDSYFGIDDLENLSARDNTFDNCVTEYNVFGMAIDSGSLSRGAVINNPVSSYNVQWGIGVNASKYVTINNPRCSFNGSNFTNAGIQVYGTSSTVNSEHVTINNPNCFANGTHGIKLSEWVNDWKIVGGTVARNFRHGLYLNTEANDGQVIGLTSRTNAQGTDSPGEYDGIKITNSRRVYIIARVDDDGTVKSHNYGIRANGTSDEIILDDGCQINGYIQGAVSLVGSNSRSGSKAKAARASLITQGLLGESFPRMLASGTLNISSGDMRATLVGLLAGDTISSICCQIGTASTGVTLAKFGIWKSDGTLVAQTTDLSSTINSTTGVKSGTLSTPYVVPVDGGYYVGVVVVGGTPPALLRGTSGITGYSGQPVGSAAPPSVGNTGKTDIGTIALTPSGNAIWFGWS